MRKFILLLLSGLLFLFTLTGCNAGDSEENKIDYISIIRAEVFDSDSELTKKMSEKVKLKLDSVTENSILITVTAPDVSSDAIEWFNLISDEEYSDEALNNKLIELMSGKAESVQYELRVNGETVKYTDEFLDAVSCGVRDFYGTLTAMFIQEMEASVND